MIRQGGGDRVHYVMDTLVGLLKFHRHGTHNIVYIGRVRFECVSGCFNSLVRVLVDIVRNCIKFDVHCLGEIPHSFGKILFRD